MYPPSPHPRLLDIFNFQHVPPPVRHPRPFPGTRVSYLSRALNAIKLNLHPVNPPHASSLTSYTLTIPALLSASSAFLLLLNLASTRNNSQDEQEHQPSAYPEGSRKFFNKFRRYHANRFNGCAILIWRILRLLAVSILLGLEVATLILTEDFVPNSPRHPRFLNWTVLGAYVRVRNNFFSCAEKSVSSHSYMRVSWL